MIYAAIGRRASLAGLLTALALPAAAQVPSVVVDTPVAHSLAAMVMGDLGAPVLLLDRGADPHNFALRPSQARAVADAGLAIWVGEALTPWMARATASLAPAAQLELLAVEGVALQPFAEQALFAEDDDHHDHGHSHGHSHGHAHGHSHGHAHGHSHGHDDHDDDHGDIDPHAWLDPDIARAWIDAIAARLIAIDPANATTYAANADAAKARIAEVIDQVAAILGPVGDAGIVVHHDAYGYFARAFGVNVLGSVALGDAAAPGAQRLAAIRAALTDSGAVCIFPEANHSAAHAPLIAEGTGLRIGAPLDPEGVTLDPGAGLYPALLTGLAQAIADCVGGA